mmetsp:Transcript_24192/g.67748  ORF Transcript_24192/g.67748 Transcript_24192/m.67748 type:complete len:458 (-) Transcript_24192:619-1992(-)
MLTGVEGIGSPVALVLAPAALLDGHKRRVGAHQLVLGAEGHDLVPDLRAVAGEAGGLHPAAVLLEVADHGARGEGVHELPLDVPRGVHRQLHGQGALGRLRGDGDARGRFVLPVDGVDEEVLPVEHRRHPERRLVDVHLGRRRRRRLRRHVPQQRLHDRPRRGRRRRRRRLAQVPPPPVHLHVAQRRLDGLLQLLHHLGLHARRVRHELRRPLPRPRQPLHQVVAHRVPDPQREHPRVPAVLLHQLDHLVRVRHLPVRQHEHLPRVPLDRPLVEHVRQRLHQLRAPQVRPHRLDRPRRRPQRPVVVLARRVEQRHVPAPEPHDVEVAVLRQRPHEQLQRVLRLLDPRPRHGPAPVQHEHDLHRHVRELEVREQRHHPRQAAPFVHLEAHPWLVRRRHRDVHNHVLRHRLLPELEPHRRRRPVDRLRDLVRRRRYVRYVRHHDRRQVQRQRVSFPGPL